MPGLAEWARGFRSWNIPAPPGHRSMLPLAELFLALGLFAVSSLSILLTRAPGGIALFWPGNAIAASILIRMLRVRRASTAGLLWLGLFLAQALVAHRAWHAAAGIASINLLEIALMVAAFRGMWRFPYPNITIAQATFMTAVGGVSIPALTALLAGALLAVEYTRPFQQSALHWWSSHALGTCLVGPPIILFSRAKIARLMRRRFLAANIALLLLCLAAEYLALRFLRFPYVAMSLVLLIGAFRVGGLGTALLALASGLLNIGLWALEIRPIGLEATAPSSSLVDLPVIALLGVVLPAMSVGIGTDARRAAVGALRASERQFREAMENSPIGILIADLDGTWRHCNRALCLMLGYSAAELRALPPGGPSVGGEWDESKDRWQRLLSGELDSYHIERRFQHKEGHWVWTHVAVSLMRDESGAPLQLIAHIESLEARRQAAQRIAEERERLVTTLQSISDAVITTDNELQLMYINSAAETLLGVSRSEVLHRRLAEVLYLTDAETSKTAANLVARSIASGESITRESGCVLHRPDGSVRYVRDSVSPVLGPEGMQAGTVIVLRDVTREMDRERDLEQRATHDALTGLIARGEFAQRLRTVFEKARHKDRPAALVAIDLDRFKSLNDSAGHAAGDAMLCRVADVCRSMVRASDTIARLGGDELVILLESCRPERAVAVSQQLCRRLNPLEMEWNGTLHSIGASIGVAMLAPALTDEQEWLAVADQACYHAKRAGRGQVQFAGTGGVTASTSRG